MKIAKTNHFLSLKVGIIFKYVKKVYRIDNKIG